MVARTSQVVALYEDRGGLACWHDDYAELVALIRARRHRAAASLMQKHLSEIEDGLRLHRPPGDGLDIWLMLMRPG